MLTSQEISHLRAVLGWSQQKLADETGLSQKAISAIESGKTKPRKTTLQKIYDTFQKNGISLSDDTNAIKYNKSNTVKIGRGLLQATDPTIEDEWTLNILHIHTLISKVSNLLAKVGALPESSSSVITQATLSAFFQEIAAHHPEAVSSQSDQVNMIDIKTIIDKLQPLPETDKE